jgi:hypothetical protein
MKTASSGRAPADLSIILTAYQSEQFVGEAVRSVLAQEGVVADIILSDDASSDQTYAILSEVTQAYVGPHHVRLRRNAHNVGMDHGFGLIDLAQTEVIVMAHADDISEPQRCRRILDEMRSTGAYAATSNYLEIDAAGRAAGLHLPSGESRSIAAEEIARTGWQDPLVGSTLALRREVVTRFDPITARFHGAGHDTLLPFRAAVLGGMRYIHEPLIRRRRHAGQLGLNVHNTSSRDTFLESRADLEVKLQVCMARDLRRLVAESGPADRSRLDSLQQIVHARLLELVEQWMAARQTLAEQGLRPTWVSGEEHFQAVRQSGRPALREQVRRQYRRWRWQLFRR